VKKTYDSNRSNKTIIIALAVTAVWLVAISVSISPGLSSMNPPTNLWIAFVWAVPIFCGRRRPALSDLLWARHHQHGAS
jgi:hypothetical protein